MKPRPQRCEGPCLAAAALRQSATWHRAQPDVRAAEGLLEKAWCLGPFLEVYIHISTDRQSLFSIWDFDSGAGFVVSPDRGTPRSFEGLCRDHLEICRQCSAFGVSVYIPGEPVIMTKVHCNSNIDTSGDSI